MSSHKSVLWVAASQAAEKLKFLSFRGTLRAEESLILLTLEPREIPHFVRNDKIAYFFRSGFRRDVQGFGKRWYRPPRDNSTTFEIDRRFQTDQKSITLNPRFPEQELCRFHVFN